MAQASMGSSSPFHQGLVGTAVKLGGFIQGMACIEIPDPYIEKTLAMVNR